MKIAVISDIHGNLESFVRVLADMDRVGFDLAVCLGDIIGYGPNPQEVVDLLRARSIPSVMGNHELALVQPDFLDWFNDAARASLLLTERMISGDTRKWLESLPATMVFENALFVHGCPPDSITEYILEWSDAGLGTIFSRMENRLCFVGHTHTLDAISFAGSRVRHHSLGAGIFELDPNVKYIINVGSVGQPRDRCGNNAKYALWDTAGMRVEIRSVPYDVVTTTKKIICLGFPSINAYRLQ